MNSRFVRIGLLLILVAGIAVAVIYRDRFVAFTRLVPLFPFNSLNYALGLTRIKLSHYLLATYTCMLPGAMAYTYVWVMPVVRRSVVERV